MSGDIRLWDIENKHFAFLCGAQRTEIAPFANGPRRQKRGRLARYPVEGSASLVAEEFRSQAEDGLRCGRECGRTPSVREDIKPTVKVMLDASHAYHSAAASRLRRMIGRKFEPAGAMRLQIEEWNRR
ncbi:hypothetical protein [Bradyrhizobium forestalis]|uniref:hypothetical protein n=1 Tax=Bradyrhizobium forestalis TaxID=1419263 RepID=UPI0011AF9FF1|nr:hypothetical protein [Bradyrhizobium forestalis]